MRNAVIDVVKAIAIIMIVNVHLVSGSCFFIGSTYHVIAFFFVSGVLQAINPRWEKCSIGVYLKHRTRKLMYPYFSLSFCYIAFRLIINICRGHELFDDVIFDAFLSTITFRGVGTLWFFPIFFLSDFIFNIIHRWKIKDIYILTLGVIAIVISSHFNSNGICGKQWYGDTTIYGLMVSTPLYLILASVIASFFIELGYLVQKIMPSLINNDSIIKKKNNLILVSIVCALSFSLNLVLRNGYVGDLHKLDIGDPFVYLVCSVFGLSFVLTLSILICTLSKKLCDALSFLGRNSIIIMTTHSEYMLTSISYFVVCYFAAHLNQSIDDRLISYISLFLIILIEIIVIQIVNSTPIKYIYQLPKKSLTKNK